MKKMILLATIALACLNKSTAQTLHDSTDSSPWSYHFQLTVISQYHSGFKAPYSGNNSLADSVEPGATSITSTLYLGRKLWKGAALYFNPEISGGRGLSSAVGVAGALNGETYRIGNPEPVVSVARAYIQQHIPLGNTAYEKTDDDINQVADYIPSSRITISAGKFSMSDFYDDNKYSHDARSQFLNWSLMSDGAWDYPANTKGYTMGVVAELIQPQWAIRLSSVAVPRIANAPDMEYNISKAHSETLELEHKTTFSHHPGTVRFTFSNTYSRAPSYADGLKAIASGNQYLLNVISGKAENTNYGGRKPALGLSADQELTNDIGVFARAGWNDGKYASWAFTEIDQTFHLGLSVNGRRWKRAGDTWAIAGVINGISTEHRNFLKTGGYGFIIGDGTLTYGNEKILETYYSANLAKYFWLSLDYQFVANPGYNKDRGPVHVFAIRGHIGF